MTRRVLGGLAPLLVIAAFVAMPAAAQAEPHWYKSNVLVGPTPEVLLSKGHLVFVSSTTRVIKCRTTDEQEIWNPGGLSGPAGEDRTTQLILSMCKPNNPKPCGAGEKVEVIALGLAWPTHLVAGSPITDETENMLFEAKCSGTGTFHEEYSGTLAPEVGTNALHFTTTTGTLVNQAGGPVSVVGVDKLAPHTVRAKDP